MCNIIMVSRQAETAGMHLERHYAMVGKRDSKFPNNICKGGSSGYLYCSEFFYLSGRTALFCFYLTDLTLVFQVLEY